MDKLRALEYFVAAAEAGSFSGAARRLHVSAMAVSKLIGALEVQLAAALFDRHARGLSLTSAGATYLQMCKPGMAQLLQADEMLSASARDLRGTVVVGVQHIVATRFLVPALSKFMLRYPDIQIDLRDFTRATEEQTRGIDVFLRMGWVETEGLVMRRLAVERFLVCATPAYWGVHGIPQQPSDLREHNCLLFRNALDSTMDLWEFERGEERASVVVRGQLVAGNAHVFAADELGLAGVGVCHIGDLGHADAIGSGKLVPVLSDWHSSFRPPVTLLYRPSVRRVPRVRRFIEFVEELFRALEASRAGPVALGMRPYWAKRSYERTSEAATLRVKAGKRQTNARV
jgi:LysR family transcriptional regulator, regulator for bpeEF and oprC